MSFFMDPAMARDLAVKLLQGATECERGRDEGDAIDAATQRVELLTPEE
jgi:hypothetical protein